MNETKLLMILRYDPKLGYWVVNEDSVHHLDEFAAIVDVVMLEVADITPMTRAVEE